MQHDKEPQTLGEAYPQALVKAYEYLGFLKAKNIPFDIETMESFLQDCTKYMTWQEAVPMLRTFPDLKELVKKYEVYHS